MNLHKRKSLDPRWTSYHKDAVEGFMTADIKVIRKSGDPDFRPTYDQVNKTWTTNVTTIFEGKARIQPYGIIGDTMVAQDLTGRRLMRVQIAETTTGIAVDDMLSVTFCEASPELVNFTMEVRGTIGSSNAWLTDLVCEANLKVG